MSHYDYELKNAKTIQHMSRKKTLVSRVLKRTVSMRRSCLVPTTMFGLDETKLFMHLCIDVKALSHYDV